MWSSICFDKFGGGIAIRVFFFLFFFFAILVCQKYLWKFGIWYHSGYNLIIIDRYTKCVIIIGGHKLIIPIDYDNV